MVKYSLIKNYLLIKFTIQESLQSSQEDDSTSAAAPPKKYFTMTPAPATCTTPANLPSSSASCNVPSTCTTPAQPEPNLPSTSRAPVPQRRQLQSSTSSSSERMQEEFLRVEREKLQVMKDQLAISHANHQIFQDILSVLRNWDYQFYIFLMIGFFFSKSKMYIFFFQ